MTVGEKKITRVMTRKEGEFPRGGEDVKEVVQGRWGERKKIAREEGDSGGEEDDGARRERVRRCTRTVGGKTKRTRVEEAFE